MLLVIVINHMTNMDYSCLQSIMDRPTSDGESNHVKLMVTNKEEIKMETIWYSKRRIVIHLKLLGLMIFN